MIRALPRDSGPHPSRAAPLLLGSRRRRTGAFGPVGRAKTGPLVSLIQGGRAGRDSPRRRAMRRAAKRAHRQEPSPRTFRGNALLWAARSAVGQTVIWARASRPTSVGCSACKRKVRCVRSTPGRMYSASARQICDNFSGEMFFEGDAARLRQGDWVADQLQLQDKP